MDWDFKQLILDAEAEIVAVCDDKALEEYRIKYLGRKGLIQQIYSQLSALPSDKKPLVGKNANDFKIRVTQLIEDKRRQVVQPSKNNQTAALDVTIPGVPVPVGSRHILSQTINEICDLFGRLGFAVQEGPEIETEFHNFSALNIPIDHPSRDAFDTFYLEERDPLNKDRYLLLRSHTSPGQIRIMKQHKPPLAVVIPGRVYRPDAVDASHSFMFHQIEGLLVDKDVKFSQLKGLLTVFCKKLFGDDITMRFRPHYFPFTEPSAEVDISWKHGKRGWLEIMGCGMVHPHVFEAAGYPKGKYTGLAFGLGVERIAMLKYGIDDIRLFFENDVRFLKQF